MQKIVTCVVAILLGLVSFTTANDVTGCGGFIKSDVELDISHVQVKLFTKSGIMKYETNCAPNSGYYMVPVYDKGEYILKVESQLGWRFEPESVELTINGEDDLCSQSVDINFLFAGFSIEGTVISKGYKSGPTGVSIELSKTGSDGSAIMQTVTVGGRFSFEKVMPGIYVVSASHPTLLLEKNKAKAEITRESIDIGNAFTVTGYDVTGQVFSDGEPVQGVNFILLSTVKISQLLLDCEKPLTKDLDASVSGYHAVCQVKSDVRGRFVFKAVPCGQYVLIPFYKGDNIKFDVVPGRYEFKVEHDSVSLKDAFQVAGFTVTGAVRLTKGGKGIANARVTVGDKQAVSSDSGVYLLDGMKAGTYRVKVEADNMIFDDTEVKISPSTPKLPDILPSKFSVCGSVNIEHKESLPDSLSHKISVKKSNGQQYDSVKTKPDGNYCVFCHPGRYVFKVDIAESLAKASVKLVPDEQEVIVSDQPISGIVFSQFSATVTGSVHCIESCGVLQLTLSDRSRGDNKKILQFNENGKRVSFSFTDVAPGKYKVSVSEAGWCWEATEQDIEVITSNVSSVEFRQTGYIVSYSSSHDIMAKVYGQSKQLVNTLKLKSGFDKFCVEKPGIYNIEPVTCLTYEETSYPFNTAQPEVVQLQAVGRVVDGLMIASNQASDISIQITSSLKPDEPHLIQSLKPETVSKDPKEKAASTLKYRFTYNARNGEKLTFKPSSSLLLFHPKVTEVTISLGSCPGDIVKFEGRMGYFVEGQVHPGLDGVLIHVYIGDTEVPLAEALTNINGSYKVGPLEGKADYKIMASKEGYKFTEVQNQPGHFTSFQLSQITVEVLDESSSQLAGVLLALSGSSTYRNNSISQAEVATVFSQLLPGKYFLKAMMKEYQFEPSSDMIELVSGANAKVSIRGKRISFSCLGTVESLNGEMESGIRIEAVGLDSCNGLQEESNTNPDGTFRIRGLKPGCEYNVYPKSEGQDIQRSIPKAWKVKMEAGDHSGVKFIAIRSPQQVDISGIVHSSSDTHLDTLKVDLHRLTPVEALLSSTAVDKTSFFYCPSIPLDGQEYLLKLTSSLSQNMYEFGSTEVHFVANTSYRHFVLKFNPKRKSVDQETTRDSVIIMPIAILVLCLLYNYNHVIPFVQSSGLLNAVSGLSVFQSVLKPQQQQTQQQQSQDISGEWASLSDTSGLKKKQKAKKIQ